MAETATVPETPAPAPEAPAPDAPTTAELYSTLEAERIARLQAEQENNNLRSAMYMQRPQPNEPQSPGLEGVVNNFITDPTGAARNLQGHIQSEAQRYAREEAQRAAAQTEARMRQEVERQRYSNLIENAKIRIPEFQDEAKLGGALTQAGIEAQRQGLRLSPEQLMERAARIVRTGKPPQAAPFVEGSGSGSPVGSPSNVPNQPIAKSMLEKLYGAKAGEIPDMGDINMVEYTAKFVQAENEQRRKHGITPSGSVIQPPEISEAETA